MGLNQYKLALFKSPDVVELMDMEKLDVRRIEELLKRKDIVGIFIGKVDGQLKVFHQPYIG
jgi:hypothetical protein